MSKVKVAAIQMRCVRNINVNIEKAESLVREAASNGANIILLQEFFENVYFCQKEKLAYYNFAKTIKENDGIKHFRQIAKELNIVLPISFYERKNNARYNSVAIIDADGSYMGVYRKSHIPDGPGYEEKFYFNSGDTGFKVFKTKYATIGVGICWDQWFPEAARIMTLMGAELLFYPTAIGSEPDGSGTQSKEHWQRCMQGHAAANIIPVIASNRIGTEKEDEMQIDFYGSSFMTDEKGKIIAEASEDKEQIIYGIYNLKEIDLKRVDWAVFRDRRPDLYSPILTLDGGK
ncbi:MAG: N-carbamoylputrescine amidase [Vallitalea sp.]|jgi:N-carbamoylputrescine amidase|nr:N-carbamoylputrescine amidase [Vallitalea sp.]